MKPRVQLNQKLTIQFTQATQTMTWADFSTRLQAIVRAVMPSNAKIGYIHGAASTESQYFWLLTQNRVTPIRISSHRQYRQKTLVHQQAFDTADYADFGALQVAIDHSLHDASHQIKLTLRYFVLLKLIQQTNQQPTRLRFTSQGLFLQPTPDVAVEQLTDANSSAYATCYNLIQLDLVTNYDAPHFGSQKRDGLQLNAAGTAILNHYRQFVKHGYLPQFDQLSADLTTSELRELVAAIDRNRLPT